MCRSLSHCRIVSVRVTTEAFLPGDTIFVCPKTEVMNRCLLREIILFEGRLRQFYGRVRVCAHAAQHTEIDTVSLRGSARIVDDNCAGSAAFCCGALHSCRERRGDVKRGEIAAKIAECALKYAVLCSVKEFGQRRYLKCSNEKR